MKRVFIYQATYEGSNELLIEFHEASLKMAFIVVVPGEGLAPTEFRARDGIRHKTEFPKVSAGEETIDSARKYLERKVDLLAGTTPAPKVDDPSKRKPAAEESKKPSVEKESSFSSGAQDGWGAQPAQNAWSSSEDEELIASATEGMG